MNLCRDTAVIGIVGEAEFDIGPGLAFHELAHGAAMLLVGGIEFDNGLMTEKHVTLS